MRSDACQPCRTCACRTSARARRLERMTTPTSTVAVLGLGRMGAAMAHRLDRAGLDRDRLDPVRAAPSSSHAVRRQPTSCCWPSSTDRPARRCSTECGAALGRGHGRGQHDARWRPTRRSALEKTVQRDRRRLRPRPGDGLGAGGARRHAPGAGRHLRADDLGAADALLGDARRGDPCRRRGRRGRAQAGGQQRARRRGARGPRRPPVRRRPRASPGCGARRARARRARRARARASADATADRRHFTAAALAKDLALLAAETPAAARRSPGRVAGALASGPSPRTPTSSRSPTPYGRSRLAPDDVTRTACGPTSAGTPPATRRTSARAFLPTAHVEGIRDGEFVSWPLDDYCALFAGRRPRTRPDRRRRIEQVTSRARSARRP